MDKLTNLPHQSTELFLTDGGLETTLAFIEGYELPCFAAFDLLNDNQGFQTLKNYYHKYLDIADSFNAGFILETPTWRANPDWINTIGYPASALNEINKKAVDLMVELKEPYKNNTILISGCIGPRGDGYKVETMMNIDEAKRYHSIQISALSKTQVNMISALTMTYSEEAIGITNAATEVGLPTVISFTVETDGKLPSGEEIKDAIEKIDRLSDQPPIYYMINCAHPSHFYEELIKGQNQSWVTRIKGIRANASCKSHSELDEATELDRGNPLELALEHQQLKTKFPHLNVFGGCCGTDEEHVMSIAKHLSKS